METKNIGILEASLRYRQGQEKIYVSTEPPAPVFVLTAEGNQDEVEAELIKKIIMNTITVIAYHKYKDGSKFIDEVIRLKNIYIPNV